MERVSLPRHFATVRTARDVDEPTELIPVVAPSEPEARHDVHRAVQQEVHRPVRPQPRRPVRHDDPATEPLTVEIPPVAAPIPKPEPVSRNGFHIAAGDHFRPIANGTQVPDVLAKFGITGQGAARRNRHYREDPDDTDALGRHSQRDR